MVRIEFKQKLEKFSTFFLLWKSNRNYRVEYLFINCGSIDFCGGFFEDGGKGVDFRVLTA